METNYDLVIVGGGPAGAAAAVYAARKRIKSALITAEFGGQSVVSPDIQNWVGTVSISGNDLARSFEEHVNAYAGDVLETKKGERVSSITKNDAGAFEVTTDKGMYTSRAILIATGADRRKLDVPGADEFEHKGLTYCASCDGPLFEGQDVAVIGGGNAGFETAAQLLAYTKSVTLLQRPFEYKADKITVEKVLAHEKMKGVPGAKTVEIYGEGFVKGLKYKIEGSDEIVDLPVTGVFVEIGLMPATGYVEGLVDMDEYKRIIIDPWTQATSQEGVWAAGDCSNVHYHQNNIAAGDAVKALEDIYIWLAKN